MRHSSSSRTGVTLWGRAPMAFATMKSYPMIISQSVMSATYKFPDRVLLFAKSGRFKRSCSQNSILIVASWVPPPMISPLATFRRTGLRLGCGNTSLNNLLRTRLTWAPVSTKISTTKSSCPHRTRTFKCNCRSSPCGVWTTLTACNSSTSGCIRTSRVWSRMV